MRSGQCFKDNVHFKFSIEATEHNEEIAKDDMREEHLTPDDFIAADFVNKTFDGYRHVVVDKRHSLTRRTVEPATSHL